MAPIFLPTSKAIQASDDAGILITKNVLPSYTPGPYSPDLLPNYLAVPNEFRYVPPLEYFCINSLIQNVDLIDLGSYNRIPYHPESHLPVLKGFIAFFHRDIDEKDMVYVDPRVWSALIQIYSALPECFETYTLPLCDTHMTMLQGIQSTADFTIITVLDLASRPEMNDETISALKPLTNLCILDLSRTNVGSWGVRKLSMCLTGSGGDRIGPWSLRVWSLRECRRVDDSVKATVSRFPLLSVIDLRGTSVKPCLTIAGFSFDPPPSHDRLFYPNPPLEWTSAIWEIFPQCGLFKADPRYSRPHVLHINKLRHSKSILPRRISAPSSAQQVGDQDSVIMLFPNGRQAVDTAHGLAQERKEADRKRTKDAYYPSLYAGGRENEWPHRMLRWSGQSEDDDEGDYYGPEDDDEGTDYYGSEDDEDDDEGTDYHETGSEDHGTDYYDDMGPFYLDDMAGRFAEDRAFLSGGVTLNQLGNIHAQNDVAALVSSREAAEGKARRFYATNKLEKAESTLRLRGGALPSERSVVDTKDERQMNRTGQKSRTDRRSRPLSPITDDNCQRRFMFFRTPPSFHCIPDGRDVGSSKRKNSDKEVVSVKRRKASTIIKDSSKLLWDRKRMVAHACQTEERENEDLTRFSTSSLSRSTGTLASWHGQNVDSSSSPASMNPFLAKKQLPSRCLNTARNIELPATVSCSGSSGSMSLPATNKSRPMSRPQRITGADSGTEKSSRESSRAARKKRGFDMKAWAT